MRKLLYRDEPFHYDVRHDSDFLGILGNTVTIVRVFKERDPGIVSLFRPFKEIGSTVVRAGESNVDALTRLLDGIHQRKAEEDRPLLLKCSKEIEEIYGP